MIRTHRPRGYAWNCASLFQQTPDFRDISYESCLIDDESDDFAPSERSAKRQRIEKLADDFLNGHALYISSARLPPQAIQHAIARSFARPKDARRATAGIEVTNSSEAVWEEMQDEWEVLQAYNAASDVDDDVGQDMPMVAAESEDEEVVVEVHAQASCSSHRRQRIVKLALGPSHEALRQAAALRNRTLLRRSGRLSAPSIQRAQSEAVIEETQEDSATSSLQASVSDIGPTPTAAWTSSKWLNSGMLEPHRKAVDEECSKDELGLSSLPTPSQKAAARPEVSLRRGRSALSQQSTDAASSSLQSGLRSSDSTHGESERSATTAYVLLPPLDQSDQEVALVPEEESQEDSRAQILRRQGIRAAPRKSWASFGATAISSADSSAPLESAPSKEPSISAVVRESVQESASMNAGKAPKGRRATKSTGAAQSAASVSGQRRSARRKTAPSESQAAADSMADLPVDQQRGIGSFRAVGEKSYMSVAGKDSSPFIYRKKVSKFANDDEADIETLVVETRPQTKTPKRVNFPSDSPQLVQAKATPTPAVADPKTPLVNEYLNRLVPKTGESGSRSSSVRKALRDEMRLAGAEFSRVEGDLPSSQVEPVASEEQAAQSTGDTVDDSILAVEAVPEMPPPQIWPGTQVLLAEAQKDLFTSPNKENTTMYLGDKTTPQTARDVPRRQPLQTLSQEHVPMPSTQALLDGWQGWSSIKKPRSAIGKRSSLATSPSFNKCSSHANLPASDPVTSHSFDEAALRKSSLRYSISYNDSPDPQQTESLPVAAFFPASEAERRLDKSTSSLSFGQSSNLDKDVPAQSPQKPRRPSGGIASSAAFSQGQFPATNQSAVLSSLSLHAVLSSINQQAQPQPPQQQEQESSLSFSPIARSEPQKDQPAVQATPNPASAINDPPRPRLASLLDVQDSWSFSPLVQHSAGNKPESQKLRGQNNSTTEVDTPAAQSSVFQQAQNPVGDDASAFLYRTIEMDTQDLDFTVDELMNDVLGSAKRDMPKGSGLFSQ